MISRYDPGLQNTFLGAYSLNDTTDRVFSKTATGGGISAFTVTDFVKGEPFLRNYNIDSFYYSALTGTYELFVISQPSGDALLIGNFFDCDIGGFSVMKLTADYRVEWELYSFEIGSGAYQILDVGLVARDVAALITDLGEQVYISFEGDIVEYTTAPPVYLHAHYTDQYIFGFRVTHWYKLNQEFHPVDSLALDSVTFVAPVGTSFIAQTSDKMLLIDSAMEVRAERAMLTDLNTVVQLGNTIGVGNENVFMFLDSTLGPLHTHLSMPFERMNYAMEHADTAIVLSSYNGIRHSDFITRQYIAGQQLRVDSPDLSLHFIDLPDTVFFGPPYIAWHFGASLIEVENLSDDTIYTFSLESNWIPFLGFCDNYKRAWEFDDVDLLPGETREIILDPFIANMGIGYHSPFCFWIESANGFPDPNPNDNYACDAAQIATANHELVNNLVAVYPNPASQELVIRQTGDIFQYMSGKIFDVTGQEVFSFEIKDIVTTISLTDVLPGMYLIRVQDKAGAVGMKKVIVQ